MVASQLDALLRKHHTDSLAPARRAMLDSIRRHRRPKTLWLRSVNTWHDDALTVTSFNFVGDDLREALDPRLERR